MTRVLHRAGGWEIRRPVAALTEAHVVLAQAETELPLDDAAGGWLTAYRRARAALHQVHGCTGFMISSTLTWRPTGDAIGEPDPEAGSGRIVHVFGRYDGEPHTPVRAMAVPLSERPALRDQSGQDEALAAALDADSDYRVPPLPDHERCDGCDASVLTDQERWRADGVRVIRPRSVLIDPHVLVLPLRHVASAGDLTADEVASIWARCDEVLAQFAAASGSTGLSWFANDGARARQETPHVHLHVFGRSVHEPVNPFWLMRPPQ